MKYAKSIALILIGITCIITGTFYAALSNKPTEPILNESSPSTQLMTPNITPTTSIPTSEPKLEIDASEPTTPSRGDDFVPITSYIYNNVRLPMPLSTELQLHTYQMAQKHNVPFRIIMGLLGAESTWDASITTRTNKVGTFVGMGALRDIYHAERFARQGIDIYTPEGNIEAICILVREKLDMFDNNIHHALMAYNWGPNTAKAKIAEGLQYSDYSISITQYAESFQ